MLSRSFVVGKHISVDTDNHKAENTITVSINRNTLTNYKKVTKHVTSNTHHYIPQFTLMLNPPSLQKNTTNVVIQQNSPKLLMMDILMSETCWVHKQWNKIVSDIKLVFYSSTINFKFFSTYRSISINGRFCLMTVLHFAVLLKLSYLVSLSLIVSGSCGDLD